MGGYPSPPRGIITPARSTNPPFTNGIRASPGICISSGMRAGRATNTLLTHLHTVALLTRGMVSPTTVKKDPQPKKRKQINKLK